MLNVLVAVASERTYIGIDNGTTGSIGIIVCDPHISHVEIFDTPTFTEQNYTKAKKNVSRIDCVTLYDRLDQHTAKNPIALIERPMINPTRFQASLSAIRALEATLILIERLKIPYDYIDSKAWQKMLLPKGIKGSAELKKASAQKGKKMFPSIERKKDFDGLLIAYYAKEKTL